MRFYILRHGETALNAKRVMQGRLDEPLDEKGKELAAITGRAMKNIRFDRCISSPLKRASQTAEIILRESGNGIGVEYDERLLEIDFGELEGKSLSDMGEAGRAFFSDPFACPRFPHGESVADVCRRTQELLHELIGADDGKTYLLSTHGCAARAMVNFLFPDPADFWRGHAPYNCSFSVVFAEKGRAELIELDRVYYDRDLITDHYKTRETEKTKA